MLGTTINRETTWENHGSVSAAHHAPFSVPEAAAQRLPTIANAAISD
jgi:hypothetical protein